MVEARCDGERVEAGRRSPRGRPSAIHRGVEGVSTRSTTAVGRGHERAMVDAAHAVNPRCEVLTTRKSMPGAKDLLTGAVMAGGAFPHRLGLSETVLVFDHHVLRRLRRVRRAAVHQALHREEAVRGSRCRARPRVRARRGDGIQVDKVPVDELAPLVRELRIDPHLTLISRCRGVNPQNAGAYAATGVTAWPRRSAFAAKPST